MTSRTRTRTCPVCGTPAARPLVYGLPPADLLEDAEIAIGGCVIEPDAPAWRCRNPACLSAFGRWNGRL